MVLFKCPGTSFLVPMEQAETNGGFTAMFNHIKLFCLISVLLIAGCQAVSGETLQQQANGNRDSENSVPPYTFEDAFGDHNPLMIAGWGGEKTREAWFLRCARQSPRMMLLDMGMSNYYARHSEFPSSWQALDESGYFPIRPIDPITSQPFCFTKAPEANDDFVNMLTEATSTEWVVKGQAIKFPEGEYYPYEWDFGAEDDYYIIIAEQDFDRFPSDYAMRGFNLTRAVEYVLKDFEGRRAEMPETHEQLLDSLWYVANEWAENDPSIDYTQPGGFMFGIDQGKGISYAIWRDESGQEYVETWRWDPWPVGWQEMPTAEPREGEHGVPWFDPEPDFVPETILWTCNLGG